MKDIYLGIGDTLQVVERREDGSRMAVRVQCVEKVGCVGCYFREKECEGLLCSRGDRIDGKSVIFSEVERIERKGGEE